jgi:hypothetical protein
MSKRLDEIPGVGPALTTALVASVADPFARDPISYALETDWLAGAGRFEPPHQESCQIGSAAIVAQRVAADRAQSALSARHDSSEASYTNSSSNSPAPPASPIA